jgi:molybdopterin-binding protein
VLPWEITLEPRGTAGTGTARNRLLARVTDVTPLGNRVRVGLALPQPLVAEVTEAGIARVGLAVGDQVLASFKATATRLIEA